MSPVVATPEQLEIIENRSRSVARMFYDRVEQSANREAYRYPDENEVWHSMTWAETGEHVTRLAAGLVALGIEPEQRVAIASGTRYEWIFADLAINAAAAATTTVYPSTAAEDVAYILADSSSRILFAEDESRSRSSPRSGRSCPTSSRSSRSTALCPRCDGDWVIGTSWSSCATCREGPERHRGSRRGHRPHDLATLIYTSGTTGRPKGVLLSHDGWTFEGATLEADSFSPDDLEFRWLPLAHSSDRCSCGPAREGYACAIDGPVPKIVEHLTIVKPTFMGAVPRIFEKVYGRISAWQGGGRRQVAIFRWAEAGAATTPRHPPGNHCHRSQR